MNENKKNKAFRVVFEDDYIIVVDKVAKILVQPAPGNDKLTLNALLEKYAGRRLFPCHRLDRETTGLIMYAKLSDIQANIARQFASGEIIKKYIAFIKQGPLKKRGVFEGAIIDRQGKTFGEKPKQARTLYRIVEKLQGFNVIELKPLTGRTNQLRIQLAKAGCPILGETKYAFRRDFSVRFKRLGLHAFYLSFIHPVSKDRVEVKIGLAQDMKRFLSEATTFQDGRRRKVV
ncbi:MAG: RNA pseudouridine synthase [Candidatus Omnitrophica bacterium]|nr:RNA pseudouridine synthase [Candidatus Omnitrophota bacterium]MDD5429576.1 RNA pseudouridine synthase [Candidatus Omnitrophota bacterium]